MGLIQIALAAEEFFREQPVIQLSQSQCVRSKNVHAACDRCATSCPTGAITLSGSVPQLADDRCIKCGVCLHTCPVGAFERPDGLYNLLYCAERISPCLTLDIACPHHPTAAKTDPTVDSVIQTRNCLAELGPSAYVGLLATGIEHVRARLDVCETCPLRVLQPQIDANIMAAQRILSAAGFPDALTSVTAPDAKVRARPVYQSSNPPVSRRGFFTMFSAQTPSIARAIVPAQARDAHASKHTARERERLLRALRLLPQPPSDTHPAATLQTDTFAQLSVDDNCTACGLCERVCPVGALYVDHTDDDTFAVLFAPDRCTNCGLCTTYCEVDALHSAGKPAVQHVMDSVVLALREGDLRHCERCNTRFASSTDSTLCPACQQRRDNPTGRQVPEAMLSNLPEATRQRLQRAQSNQHAYRI